MPKRPKPVDTKLFAKPRHADAERAERLARKAEQSAVEAAKAAWAAWRAAQDEQAAWTPEKSLRVEATRIAAEEAKNWATAMAEAARQAEATRAAREAVYTKAETTIADTLNKISTLNCTEGKEDDE